MEDGFASIRSDLKSLWIELEDIKKRLTRLEKRTLEDSNAFAEDLVTLRKKVLLMEKALKLHGITI